VRRNFLSWHEAPAPGSEKSCHGWLGLIDRFQGELELEKNLISWPIKPRRTNDSSTARSLLIRSEANRRRNRGCGGATCVRKRRVVGIQNWGSLRNVALRSL
jgi:hypothetical protein